MPKITKKLVDSLRPDAGKDYWLWDEPVPGFGVRVWPSGRKVYVAQYRAGGRTRRVGLGTHGAVTPGQARKEAMKVLAEVATGADPARVKAQERRAPTVADLFERYLAEHAQVKKKASSVVKDRQWISRFILPRLGKMKVAEVQRADVAAMHHAQRAPPTKPTEPWRC